MRNDVQAQGSTLTAGELRAALEGVDDAAPVYLRTIEGDIGLDAAQGADLEVFLLSDYLEGLFRELAHDV